MKVRIDKSWERVLAEEFSQDSFKTLATFVHSEYETAEIYPRPDSIFKAFNACPFDRVKVVIIGQDPYHGPGQANGLCFSVDEGVKVPPSLRNIYKEIQRDVGVVVHGDGQLEPWARQGVLLLNATLTVRKNAAGSHQDKGWEVFTDAVIHQLSTKRENIVFMLWGTYAQRKGSHINEDKHLVLRAPHPSPLSAHRGFFGSGHFSAANRYLSEHGTQPIKW